MRSSNSRIQGKVEAINSETPLENGLPPKERLPTIQIDTVPSPPPSPEDWSPIEEGDETEQPVDETEIQLDLETAEQESETSQEELKEFLKSYVEDLLSQAMVLAEKKLQFAGLPEEDEEEEHSASSPPPSESAKTEEPEPEIDDSEIRAAAEKVVEEVISKATETAEERLANGAAGPSFPDLPSIQIDCSALVSVPSSPEPEEETPLPKKKWKFTMDDDAESTVLQPEKEEEESILMTFDEAPEDVREAAANFVKEIVGRAVAMAEEKSIPSVPFSFEDVDLMKTSGPWYIRAREALIRLLRTACFCTPRRSDS